MKPYEISRFWSLVPLLLLAGCSSTSPGHAESQGMVMLGAADGAGRMAAPSPERKIVRSGDISVVVDDSAQALAETERIVTEAGGFVEWSQASVEDRVHLRGRVPSDRLDAIMDQVGALGSEESRSVSASDVTEQHADLSTRLTNGLALRERLRDLLERATDVEDILAIEKELNRIQSEVERLEKMLERLDAQIELSALSVTLRDRQVLGPLGVVGYGLWWALSKLFVIR